jgi:hypothetical protein
MTGNLISEGGSRPSLPLLDRCEKYLVEADVTSWIAWSGKIGRIHPAIIAFINDNPNMLMGAVNPEEQYADTSPRGWARASHIIYQGEARGWDTDLLNNKVHGCVGKQAGMAYKNYYAFYQELLPLIADIFNGQNVVSEYNQLSPSKRLIACMIACARLATQLDQSPEGVFPPSVKYVGKFFANVDFENVLVGVRSQITVDRIVKYNLDDHKDWATILTMIQEQVTVK